ncbi:MAG: class F sortase [Sporichthyaceae bacterium]
MALALTGSLFVDGSAQAGLIPLPGDKPLPIPKIFGHSQPEEKKQKRRAQKYQPDFSACSTAAKPFVPDGMDIGALETWVPVIAVARDSRGVPGTPPTNRTGRRVIAFDDDVRPGGRQGNTLLNAHTFPDGSALGNALLAKLQEGDYLALTSADGKRFCYEVTDRIQVRTFDEKARERYYATNGAPQVALIVCSGRRMGPGDWTHRTMWFASPLLAEND